MRIKSKYLDAMIYWAWELSEIALRNIIGFLAIVLGVSVLGMPVIVPVAMLCLGVSLDTSITTGVLLALVWLFLLACFASLGFKEHTLWYMNELEFFRGNDDFEKHIFRLSHGHKERENVRLFKRNANDLAFLLYRKSRTFCCDKVKLGVIDSDHNIIFETVYDAGSKSVSDLESLYAQILHNAVDKNVSTTK